MGIYDRDVIGEGVVKSDKKKKIIGRKRRRNRETESYVAQKLRWGDEEGRVAEWMGQGEKQTPSSSLLRPWSCKSLSQRKTLGC